jgi:hypothetical protein
VTLFVGAGFCEEAAYPLIMFILWVTFLVLATISDSDYHSVRLFGCAQYSFVIVVPGTVPLGKIFEGLALLKIQRVLNVPFLALQFD